MSDPQQGFSFEPAPPKLAPKLGPPVNRKLAKWLSHGASAATGEESEQLCAQCERPILVDDMFGQKFGEHAECFD